MRNPETVEDFFVGGKPKKTISRRRFMKDVSAATAGVALASALPGLGLDQARGDINLSKVVIVRHPNSIIRSNPAKPSFDQSIVGELVNRAITEFTGQEAPGLAWIQLFPGLRCDSIVGIKVNCINSCCSSHPEVGQAVVEGLASMRVGGTNFRRNNIIIWDRRKWEMTTAGYQEYTGCDPNMVRCFSTEQTVGYDAAAPIEICGNLCSPSKILTRKCDYLVNLAVLKNQSKTGVALGMNNHLGSIDNLGNLRSMDPGLVELNQKIRDVLGKRDRITIIDALVGINTEEGKGSSRFSYGGIILGADPVAVDCIGRDVLTGNGGNGALYSSYIDTAAGDPYNLGNNDPNRMDVVKQSPISLATREHVDKMIHFHKEGLATALQVEWAVNRYARGL